MSEQSAINNYNAAITSNIRKLSLKNADIFLFDFCPVRLKIFQFLTIDTNNALLNCVWLEVLTIIIVRIIKRPDMTELIGAFSMVFC